MKLFARIAESLRTFFLKRLDGADHAVTSELDVPPYFVMDAGRNDTPIHVVPANKQIGSKEMQMPSNVTSLPDYRSERLRSGSEKNNRPSA